MVCQVECLLELSNLVVSQATQQAQRLPVKQAASASSEAQILARGTMQSTWASEYIPEYLHVSRAPIASNSSALELLDIDQYEVGSFALAAIAQAFYSGVPMHASARHVQLGCICWL